MATTAANGWTPYCGAAPDPAALMGAWTLDPFLIAGLAAVAAAIWYRAPDRGRGLTAVAIMAALFVSPLCALTSALFAARAAHHVILAGVVAPLLAQAFALRTRALVPATIVSAAVFLAWHVPSVYAAALRSDLLFWALQLALVGSATWFWAAVRSAAAPAAIAALLLTMVAMGLLGALLTLAAAPLYAPHLASTWAWGLAPIEDQQLAGLVMWIPAAGLYLFAALGIAWRALAPDKARALAPDEARALALDGVRATA